jgi:hypothetical protein
MGSFASVRVKDGYTQILKTETGTLSSTRQVIEDGVGNDSALKLGTTSIEVNGDQYFTTAPTTDNAELTAIMIDANNKLVKREMGSNAFSSSVTITASSPINFTSNVISLIAAGSLAQLTSTTVATNDGFIIYDTSTTSYKGITLAELRSYLVATPTFTANTPISYDTITGAFSLLEPALSAGGVLTPATTIDILAYTTAGGNYGALRMPDLITYLSTAVVVSAAGSTGQIQYNSAGNFAATASLVVSGTAGAETLRFAGVIDAVKESNSADTFVFRKTGSVDFLGNAEAQRVVFSDDVNTGLGWRTMATVNGLGKYKAVIVDYVMFNDSESKVRVGRLSGCWNTILATSATFTDTILTYFGAGIDANPLLRISIDGSGVITIEINNSIGERIHVRAEAKFLYSYF